MGLGMGLKRSNLDLGGLDLDPQIMDLGSSMTSQIDHSGGVWRPSQLLVYLCVIATVSNTEYPSYCPFAVQLGIRGANMGSQLWRTSRSGPRSGIRHSIRDPFGVSDGVITRAPEELVVPLSRSSELLTCGSAVMLAVGL